MKILVDKLPDEPKQCPYSEYRQNVKKYSWYGCSKCSLVCEIGKPGWECPVFTGLDTVKMIKE